MKDCECEDRLLMFDETVVNHWKGYREKYQAIMAGAFCMDSKRTNFIYSQQERTES